jgi:hypothetical protein
MNYMNKIRKFSLYISALFLLSCLLFIVVERASAQEVTDPPGSNNTIAQTNSTNTFTFNGTYPAATIASGFPQGFGVSISYETTSGFGSNVNAQSGSIPVVSTASDGTIPNNFATQVVNGGLNIPVPTTLCGGFANYCDYTLDSQQSIKITGPKNGGGDFVGPLINGQPSILSDITINCPSQSVIITMNPLDYNGNIPIPQGLGDCDIAYNFIEETIPSGPTQDPTNYSDWGVAPSTLSFTGIVRDPAPPSKTFTVANTGLKTFYWYAQSNKPWCKIQDLTPGDGNGGDLSPNSVETITVTMDSPEFVGTGVHNCVITVINQWDEDDFATVAVDYTITDPNPLCGPVTNVTPSGTFNGNSVNLDWNGIAGATKYHVRVSDLTDNSYNTDPSKRFEISSGSNCAALGPTFNLYVCEGDVVGKELTSTVINNVPVVAGHDYSYWVHANVGGTLCQSAGTNFRPSGSPSVDLYVSAPSANFPVAESGGPITITYGNSVKLRTDINNADWCLFPGFGNSTADAQYNTNGLTQETTTYTITCGNNYGGVVEDSVTVKVPPPPTNLVATCVNSTTVNTTWTDPTGGWPGDEYYYRMYDDTLYDPPIASANYLYRDAITGNSRNVTVVSGNTYQWWIHTKDANGNFSTSANGSSFSCSVPSPVTNPTLSLASCPSRNVVVNWTASAGANGGTTHNIYRNTSNTIPGSVYDTVGNVTTYTDTTTSVGQTYWYWIEVVGNGVKTAAGSITVTSCPPTSPLTFNGSVPSGAANCGKVDLSWSQVASATGYYVYRYGSDDFSSATNIANKTPNTTLTHQDTGRDGRFYYWLTAYNGAGESSPRAMSPAFVDVEGCDSNLSGSDKDITRHNGVNLTTNPGSCNGYQAPPSAESFKIGDTVRFRITLCNSSTVTDATDLQIVDTLTNLEQVNSGSGTSVASWNMTYTGGTTPAIAISGTLPNQILTITNLGTVPKGTSSSNPGTRVLTFEAKIRANASFTASVGRFQNRAVVNYDLQLGNVSGPGGRNGSTDNPRTGLVYFFNDASNPEIKETPPR